jgi:SanA protein
MPGERPSIPNTTRQLVTWRSLSRAGCNVAMVILGLAALSLGLPLAARSLIRSSVKAYIYRDLADVPTAPVAVVFGAGVLAGGYLTPILSDRVETAIDLYRAGKVHKLLMTGDNRFAWYNEPGAMAAYAQARGVPAKDIVLDYAGRRTYDSCYRGLHVFGIQRAILVTQEYHLTRAVYTCRRIGIDAVGMMADRPPSKVALEFRVRELPALLVAWWDTNVSHPVPVMGDPIAIDSTN